MSFCGQQAYNAHMRVACSIKLCSHCMNAKTKATSLLHEHGFVMVKLQLSEVILFENDFRVTNVKEHRFRFLRSH